MRRITKLTIVRIMASEKTCCSIRDAYMIPYHNYVVLAKSHEYFCYYSWSGVRRFILYPGTLGSVT